ncbi:MAG: hypothetical protein ABR585_14240 [Gemmatimonadaceae bacterium]
MAKFKWSLAALPVLDPLNKLLTSLPVVGPAGKALGQKLIDLRAEGLNLAKPADAARFGFETSLAVYKGAESGTKYIIEKIPGGKTAAAVVAGSLAVPLAAYIAAKAAPTFVGRAAAAAIPDNVPDQKVTYVPSPVTVPAKPEGAAPKKAKPRPRKKKKSSGSSARTTSSRRVGASIRRRKNTRSKSRKSSAATSRAKRTTTSSRSSSKRGSGR